MPQPDLDFQRDRDATFKLIDWFKIERVKQAKVLVVGAGAIGNEVLKNLALIGIGRVYIFDKDTIEISNLSRSILYRPKDYGQAKARVASRAVKEINPAVRVFWRTADIATDLGEGFVRKMDVVIGCLDSVEARYLLNRICWRVGRPWIDAGIGTLNGHVRVFEPPDGACYECFFGDAHYQQVSNRKSCNALATAYVSQGRIPTTPTIASIVAAVQVQECLKLLDSDNWKGRTLSGRQFDFFGSRAESDVVAVPRRADCPAHDVIAEEDIIKLDGITVVSTAAALLAKAHELLGADVHLYLDSEIALERTCPRCGNVLTIMRPVQTAFREDLTCSCGHECRWESDITETHIIDVRHSPALLLDARLQDLGVRRFGLVEARGPNGLVWYLELTGDETDIVREECEFKYGQAVDTAVAGGGI